MLTTKPCRLSNVHNELVRKKSIKFSVVHITDSAYNWQFHLRIQTEHIHKTVVLQLVESHSLITLHRQCSRSSVCMQSRRPYWCPPALWWQWRLWWWRWRDHCTVWEWVSILCGCWTSLSLASISDWTLQINVFCLTMEGVPQLENACHLYLMSAVGVALMVLVNVLLQQMIALVRYIQVGSLTMC